MPKWLVDRKPSTLALITFIGLLVGSALSHALAQMPESVVRTTFTFPLVNIGIGYPEALNLNLAFFKFQIGFHLELTLLSFVGMAIGLWIYRWYE